MDRVKIANRIGDEYKTSNTEQGEYSYADAAGSVKKLSALLGRAPKHRTLDMRFEHNNVVVLVETKKRFVDADEEQLREYLLLERALHPDKKIVCILANTENDDFRVWKSEMDDAHLLTDEKAIDTMRHYESIFAFKAQNDREKVLNNTRKLNDSLHKKDIDEDLRSQFVGTALLYVRNIVRKQGIERIDEDAKKQLHDYWRGLSANQIRTGIEETLKELLGKSKNKDLKIQLLQKNVLDNQKVLKLSKDSWVAILDEIVWNIYRYINTDSPEGQDILNLFFIHFNKYTGKKDKNQAFTPDHITHFMCRVTGVNRTKRIFDGTCGSGSFLVQSMVMEYDDCNKQVATEDEKRLMRKRVSQEHIYGIEIEDVAFGLATTNMLIHGDGNSNIEKANLFESEEFLRRADPDIILMNPPYNAKPITIPDAYKDGWPKDAKEDPTKGLVFLKYISDVVEKMNKERMAAGQSTKEVKVAILLQVSAAIGGNKKKIVEMKKELLKANRLDAVFTLPDDVFYPGASPSVCCMVFTLGVPHVKFDGSVDETFFGCYKDDGHKKKKNLGRIEQFDKNDNSLWKQIEDKWVKCFANKTVEDGFSALHVVTGDDEWLCEAYMDTDYSDLTEADFQETVNRFLAYRVKEGRAYEP